MLKSCQRRTSESSEVRVLLWFQIRYLTVLSHHSAQRHIPRISPKLDIVLHLKEKSVVNSLSLVSLAATNSRESSARELDFQSCFRRGCVCPWQRQGAAPDVGFWMGAWGELDSNWIRI